MSLADKTKTALDELRMLMLGAQILLGFQFHAPFQETFTELSFLEKVVEVIVLCIMVLIIALLITPSAHHRIVGRGEATPEFNKFVTRTSLSTLAPFAVALGLDIGVAISRGLGATTGIAVGSLAGLVAAGLWYGPFLRARNGDINMTTSDEKTPTAAKIDYVLTEARVVLPGAQALLGFQLAIVLTHGFAELGVPAKMLHCIALGSVTFAIILLVTPPAYHRIVYDGAPVAEFYQIASRFLLAATIFLALGLAADIDVVIGKAIGNHILANVTAAIALLVLIGLWHLWPWWKRLRQSRRSAG
ncbi:hypothetical protein C7U61_04630 [Rhizobium sp. JAB6]|uniref:DUF6328 family protein n=1 Tax=Rhizobium sp. JAB6 TaxID=2127050 RepID=UPI000D4960F3|nr:DUF6328 family protein [Rhizobium sp. JAB6]PST22566.1 hypothetical protein C7U61_04630 [Rhizobium sp. JAB6]